MNCPYCQKMIAGFTGLLEAQRFQKHLARCRKNPNNIVMTDGVRTVVTPKRHQGLHEAVSIRCNSGQ
jgi:hypothetical protein